MGDSQSAVCPVCNEPFDERPDRCFRCGTDLTEWWTLEDLLFKDGTVPVPPPEPPTGRIFLIAIIMCALFAGFLAGRFAPLFTELVVSPRSSGPVASSSMNPAPDSSPVLYYRIQKGDSAWRVAAALTGSGLNWQLLWPELKNKPIQIGDVLEVHIDRLEALRRDRAQH